MKKVVLIVTLFILAFSCKNNKTSPKPFTRDILPEQLFLINSEKDTVLETVHGSLIQILAGSFSVAGNIKVEIKEAFTPVEILAAGLTTESNGKPLRSAGMIYVNASLNGMQINLIKPVKISMPNSFYDPEMKVFKGIVTDSGTINWVDPIQTDTTPQINNWETGKGLFRSACRSCHKIFSDGTGPALADVEYRGPWVNRKNIFEFIRNPSAYMAHNKYTQNLKAKFGSMMTAFPDLGEDGTNAILDYIKNETIRPGAKLEEQKYIDSILNSQPQLDSLSDNLDSDSSPNPVLAIPCSNDTIYLPLAKQNNTVFQGNVDSLIKSNEEKKPLRPEDMEGLRNGFTDPNPTTGMYDFEIKTFGWYNIDAYVEGYAGTTSIRLTAQIQIDFEILMHVYLFCPKNKMLSVSNEKNGTSYSFNKINKGVPLFINDRAILFAFGSKGDKMYYGISEFNVQGNQNVVVNVKETTEEEIRKALYAKEIEGIDLGIEKKEQKIIKRNCDDEIKDTTSVK